MPNPSNIIQMYKDSFSGLSRSVWLLSLIMFINRSGAMVLPFMTLFLTKSLGYSLTQPGWVMGVYGLGSIIGAYIGGQLTDKLGYYHIQLHSLIGSSFFLILLIFLTDYYLILGTVFIFSLVTDTLRPANSVAIYAAPREGEYVDRLKGATYEEIAEKGGGILNSARKLQETTEEDLYYRPNQD